MSPDAYFHDFENLLQNELAKALFVRWEEKLQHLDVYAWNALRDEASQYLNRRDAHRGFYQLFNILSQADGYQYLVKIGCSNVRFIPRSAKKTPDLEGSIESQRVLCEVKTINISDAEIRARSEYTARSVENQLSDEFFQKLQLTITGAKDQIRSYDTAGDGRHVVYVNICFDDFVGYYKDEYLRQIKQYLTGNPLPGIEVVCVAGP